MTAAPNISMVSNKENNPINGTVGLLKDVLNSHHDGKAKKIPDSMKDRMGIQMLRLNLDPVDNNARIILKYNLRCL